MNHTVGELASTIQSKNTGQTYKHLMTTMSSPITSFSFVGNITLFRKWMKFLGKQRMDKMFIILKHPFGIKLKSYFDELGVQIIENLKHLEKEN